MTQGSRLRAEGCGDDRWRRNEVLFGALTRVQASHATIRKYWVLNGRSFAACGGLVRLYWELRYGLEALDPCQVVSCPVL